jgi:DnaJ-class molecular chaperone
MEYYKLLNVTNNSSIDEIKKKYRVLSLKYHPDKGGNNNYFNKINEAYKYIINEKKNEQTEETSKEIILKDEKIIINSEMNMPKIITHTLTINLDDAYNGGVYPIDIERILINNEREKERIYINIPSGIDDNEIIIIEKKGNYNKYTNKNDDVKVFIKINNNTLFRRDGMNLYLEKKIKLIDVLCGGEFIINHLNGTQYNIKNANKLLKVTNKKVINGLGMCRDNIKGNLIIEFNVIYPDNISNEDLKVIEKILKKY